LTIGKLRGVKGFGRVYSAFSNVNGVGPNVAPTCWIDTTTRPGVSDNRARAMAVEGKSLFGSSGLLGVRPAN